jgi:hypothetical protein
MRRIALPASLDVKLVNSVDQNVDGVVDMDDFGSMIEDSEIR